MKKLEVTLQLSLCPVTVEVTVPQGATEDEIFEASVKRATEELQSCSIDMYREIKAVTKERWLVLQGDSVWTDLLKNEDECINHIKNSVKEYPMFSEKDFTYRPMTRKEVEKTGFNL